MVRVHFSLELHGSIFERKFEWNYNFSSVYLGYLCFEVVIANCYTYWLLHVLVCGLVCSFSGFARLDSPMYRVFCLSSLSRLHSSMMVPVVGIKDWVVETLTFALFLVSRFAILHLLYFSVCSILFFFEVKFSNFETVFTKVVNYTVFSRKMF